jgi:hypothetical protein
VTVGIESRPNGGGQGRQKTNIFQQSTSEAKSLPTRISLSSHVFLPAVDALINFVEKCWFVG